MIKTRPIPLVDIKPPTLSPRLDVNDESLDELAESIRVHGLIAPLVVCEEHDGYRLLAGNRRLHALQRLGITAAECRILPADNDLAEQITIAENLHRRDLSPVEEAYAFALYLEHTGKSHAQLAKEQGKERTYVTRRLLLLDLDDSTLNAVEQGIINLTQALLLRRVEDPDARAKMIQHAETYGANVSVMAYWVANWEKQRAVAQVTHGADAQPQDYEPPREVFMACDRCGDPTSYEQLRSIYVCPHCRREASNFRLQREDKSQ